MEDSNELLNEFREVVKSHTKAWSTGDIETILDFEEDSVQFGYRTKDIRDQAKFGRENIKLALEQFFGSIESGAIEPIKNDTDKSTAKDMEIRLIGNTGISFGFFNEKIKTKEGGVQEVVVRSTATFCKNNGKWKLVMSHRDIQFQ